MKLKDGMGDKLSVVANLMGTAIICLAQAFPLGWELTLACCTVVPFSIGASIILTNVSLYIRQNFIFKVSCGDRQGVELVVSSTPVQSQCHSEL